MSKLYNYVDNLKNNYLKIIFSMIIITSFLVLIQTHILNKSFIPSTIHSVLISALISL